MTCLLGGGGSVVSFVNSFVRRRQCGGGRGFFLKGEVLGRMFDNSFSASTFCCFLKVEIRSHTLVPLFSPGSVHSGLAS